MADPLSVAASVAGLLSLGISVAQSLHATYEAYKDQGRDIAYTAKKLENLFGTLESLQSQLKSRKFRAEEQNLLGTIEDSVKACEENIHDLQSRVEKCKVSSGDSVQAAARAVTRPLAYPFRQCTLRKLDADIDEIVSHVSLALQVLHAKDINGVQHDTTDAKALLDLVRADQISSTIRDWLKAPDAAVNLNDASKKKHPGTGLWFVQGPSFSAWLATPRSLLWLHGFAGCGKSVLCSTAIQYASRHRRSNPCVGIACFFFTFNDESKRNASAMLRALVVQLSSQLRDSHGLLSRLHDSYRGAMPPDQALMGCLHELVRAFDDVYIVLDALDESPPDKHRADVLQALVNIRAWWEPGLHLLVTSRDEQDIRDVLCKDLRAKPDEIISLKSNFVDSDIATFVSGHLKECRGLERWEKYHDQIEKALTERANGVFRWVECQFTALETGPGHKRQLDKLLSSLPRTLDETYERMLLRIDPESVDDARRVLTLLCCAKRPLTVPELIDGIAVELGDDPRLNPDGRLLGEDEIHRLCPGLLELDTRSDDTAPTVRIAHFSVQEYLESDRILQHKVAAFGVRRRKANAEIASVCLTYLLEPALSRDSMGGYPLALYAAKHWHEHYHDGDKSAYRAEHQSHQLFRNSRNKFESWVEIWNVDHGNGKRPEGKLPSPVYYASLLGLDLVLSKLLLEKSWSGCFSGLGASEVSDLVNAQGGTYGTALQAASVRGYERVVQLLLDKGANVNAQGGFSETALQAASVRGYERVVQLLLDKGADVKAQGGFFGTALQAASEGGYKMVVRLLLDKGADINAQGGEYGTALQAASVGGQWDVVQLLLHKGANVNAQGGEYGTALQAASARGYKGVVQVLFDKGADINAQGGYYGTALQAASARGHEEVVQLLLNKNADFNTQNGFLNTILQAVLPGGYERRVQLLFDKGANVNAQGGYYGTALQAASAGGYERVVQLLLDNGANINAQGGYYGTALQAASAGGHERVVQLLRSRGAYGVDGILLKRDTTSTISIATGAMDRRHA